MLQAAFPTSQSAQNLELLKNHPELRKSFNYQFEFTVGRKTRTYDVKFNKGQLYSVSGQKRGDFSSLSVMDHLNNYFSASSPSMK